MYRDLTDTRSVLQPLLPSRHRIGRPRANDRRIFNGICYVLRTGCRWSDLPAKYGSPATGHRRLSQWMRDGTWLRVWATPLVMLSRQDKLRLDQTMLDASLISAKKWGSPSGRLAKPGSMARSAPDRRRARCAAGLDDHDRFGARRARRGAPPDRLGIGERRHRPGCLVADKGYNRRAFRAVFAQRQIRAHIPERAFFGHRRHRGRPYLVDRARVAQRWVIERTFAWLNSSSQRLRVRYERLAHCYKALCIIGCSLICLNRLLR